MRKNACYTVVKGFATKTNGAVPYFIAESGMIFVGESNHEHRIKQIKFFINLWHGNLKMMILSKFLEKLNFRNVDYNDAEHLVLKKFYQNMKV